jgi:hypothetical protein
VLCAARLTLREGSNACSCVKPYLCSRRADGIFRTRDSLCPPRAALERF